MKRPIGACLSVLAFAAFAGPAAAQTTSPSDCTALWKQADPSAAGSLTQAQAKPYVTDFKSVDTDSDGKLSNAEFMKGCAGGQIRKGGSAGMGPGTTGSGSTGSTGSVR